MSRKAVALISGGLDSILAARLVRDQGYDVTGLYFTSAFSKSYGREEDTPAVAVSRAMNLDLRIRDLGMPYIDLIRTPRHGYGKNSNPCIDCKIFMLNEAKKVMQELGAPFVVTGEVLGQRPMSQRRDTLHVIERDAGLRGLILRPLSATVLPPTLAEQDGLIDRGRLLGISGRGRTVQLRLAERYGIRGFSTPAGGCLLTDKGFSARLKDLFDHGGDGTEAEVQLLKFGRHFRLNRQAKLIVGRTEKDNESILQHHHPALDVVLDVRDYPSPVGLLQGAADRNTLLLAAAICVGYSRAPKLSPVDVAVRWPSGEEVIQAIAVPPDDVRRLMI